jgi:hypothetical protein
MLTTILSLSLVIIVGLLALSIYFNIKHAMIILEIQDSIEKCLDILDLEYSKMNEIINTPVFFDSVEVRHVINQIKRSYDSLLIVANTLTSTVSENKNTKNTGELQ